ncbi:MAG: hypothetical protein CMJ89_03820 [Planctomycetes bacterium]|jgi:catechol 2,3-dioxygenase-like lactoylglutathione lyase family enzyme|nr:hypothetical protein [Planctomycetota bacterium]
MHHLHIALNVQDLGLSVEFYSAIFNTRPDKRTGSYARFTLENPALVLALNLKAKVRSGERVPHFGFRLEPDGTFSGIHERLLERGLLRKREQGVLCCHAVQNKLWVRDPDGNNWEFYEVLQDLTPQEAAGDGRRGCC